MLIRLASTEDLDGLITLVRHVVPLMRAAGNLQWDENYPNADVFRQDIKRAQLWIAEIDSLIAGVVAITSDVEPDYEQADWDNTQPALIVHRLAVDPRFQGLGVARELMRHAEKIALETKISFIRVDTNAENGATQHLFPSLGYRFAGEISLRMRPGLRFFCYEKRV